MGATIDVVKQNGQRATELFMRQKLHDSIVAACLSVHTPLGQAESIAQTVSGSVITWLEDKHEVTSRDIRTAAAKHLHIHHPDAAYMYEQYLVIV